MFVEEETAAPVALSPACDRALEWKAGNDGSEPELKSMSGHVQETSLAPSTGNLASCQPPSSSARQSPPHTSRVGTSADALNLHAVGRRLARPCYKRAVGIPRIHDQS